MRVSTILLAAGSVGLALAGPIQKRVSAFQWFGINESGAEFGSQNLPGVLGTDYTWPVTSTIDTLTAEGFNIFRIPFLMERAVPNEMTGPIAPAYLASMTTLVNYITNTKGAHAIICAQNFGRYYGNIITDTAGFQAFWTTMATQFKTNSKVIFDTNNEYHDMDISLVNTLNQVAINGIRAAGATTQNIFVEGDSYTGAWTWTTTSGNTVLSDLTDPENLLYYEMHQYLDSDGSGTSDVCVNSTIGVNRITAATAWLKATGKKGVLGEFAGGANSVCQTAVTGMLTFMRQNTDVWKGALWWGGGPWWGDYIFSFEPPSGTAYEFYLSTLQSLF